MQPENPYFRNIFRENRPYDLRNAARRHPGGRKIGEEDGISLPPRSVAGRIIEDRRRTARASWAAQRAAFEEGRAEAVRCSRRARIAYMAGGIPERWASRYADLPPKTTTIASNGEKAGRPALPPVVP